MQKLMCFENKKVEIINLDGMILFNPYHVGKCIDLSNSAVRNYLQTMNKKQAILLTNSIVRNKDIRKMHSTGEKFITESGLYKLIFKSRKPEAERFTDWVTDEVLPTIRKTGRYIQPTMLDMEQKEKQPIKKLYHNGKPVMTTTQVSEILMRDRISILKVVHENNIKFEVVGGKGAKTFVKSNHLHPAISYIYIFDYKAVLDILNEFKADTDFVDDYFMLDDYCFKHNKHQVFDNLITGFLDTLRFLNLGDIITQETIYLENTDDSPEMKSLMLDFFKMLKIRKTT